MMNKSLAQKVWDAHVVDTGVSNADLLYVDMHLTHEVTSPQPFEGLRLADRKVRRTDLTIATSDHDVPTDGRAFNLVDQLAQKQLMVQESNCKEFGIKLHPMGSKEQGIVHVMGPELGLTLPGMMIVCGDSHTSTHGAFGAIAFGIGTSLVEHVLATQTVWMSRPGFSRVTIGKLQQGCTAKDVALAVMYTCGTGGLQGTLTEYVGEGIKDLSMEARMTLCNMSIEAGARAGLIAPDEVTYEYLRNRPYVPKDDKWDEAMKYWVTLKSDPNTVFDKEFHVPSSELIPRVTWGTSPDQNVGINGVIPDPDNFGDEGLKAAANRALNYMDLTPGTKVKDIPIQHVFIGSCTNGRIEDLRAAAMVVAGKKISSGVHGMVVPGSAKVKQQAEDEGIAKILVDAGFEWRNPGCSMCIGMNGDQVGPGERVASTSNRNFESRQGPQSRTHLVSPSMAAASAVLGHLADKEDLINA